MPKGGKSYLLIDNRGAGLGYSEFKTLTCAHCNCSVVLHPERKRARNTCLKCMAYICDKPGCILQCSPIEQTVELILKYPQEPWLIYDSHGKPIARQQELRDRERIY